MPVGALDVVGKNIGFGTVGNLVIGFVGTANLNGPSAINAKVARIFAVLHGMLVRQLVYGEAFAYSSLVNRRCGERVHQIGVVKVYLVGFLHLLNGNQVAVLPSDDVHLCGTK